MDYLETCSEAWLTFFLLIHLTLSPTEASTTKFSFVPPVWEKNVITTLCCTPHTPFSFSNLHPAELNGLHLKACSGMKQSSLLWKKINLCSNSLGRVLQHEMRLFLCAIHQIHKPRQADRPETSPRLEKDTDARYNERVGKVRWSVRRRQHSLMTQTADDTLALSPHVRCGTSGAWSMLQQ